VAAVGLIMFQDAAITTAGVARGWKVAFGFTDKGTIVVVYVNSGNPDDPVTRNVTEIPKLANGKADINSVTSYLTGFGVSLTNSVKQVIGA